MPKTIIALIAVGLIVFAAGCGDAGKPAAPTAQNGAYDKTENEYNKILDEYKAVLLESYYAYRSLQKKVEDAVKAGNKNLGKILLAEIAVERLKFQAKNREMNNHLEKALKAYDALPDEVRRKRFRKYSELRYDLLISDARNTAYSHRRAEETAEILLKAYDAGWDIDLEMAARVFMGINCYSQAEKFLQRLADAKPNSGQWSAFLIEAKAKLGRYAQAGVLLDKLAKSKNLDGVDLDTITKDIEEGAKEAESEKKFLEQDAAKTGADKQNPRVLLKTTRGEIEIELFEDDAPNSVANFVSLVEKGFYDGTLFHRVEGWVVQGGSSNGDGTGGPDYTINTEINPRKHFPAYLGMARAKKKNTENSQFYFVKYLARDLDKDGYTVFGRIVRGMDAMIALEQGDKIESALVLRKRSGSAYEPVVNDE